MLENISLTTADDETSLHHQWTAFCPLCCWRQRSLLFHSSSSVLLLMLSLLVSSLQLHIKSFVRLVCVCLVVPMSKNPSIVYKVLYVNNIAVGISISQKKPHRLTIDTDLTTQQGVLTKFLIWVEFREVLSQNLI